MTGCKLWVKIISSRSTTQTTTTKQISLLPRCSRTRPDASLSQLITTMLLLLISSSRMIISCRTTMNKLRTNIPIQRIKRISIMLRKIATVRSSNQARTTHRLRMSIGSRSGGLKISKVQQQLNKSRSDNHFVAGRICTLNPSFMEL